MYANYIVEYNGRWSNFVGLFMTNKTFIYHFFCEIISNENISKKTEINLTMTNLYVTPILPFHKTHNEFLVFQQNTDFKNIYHIHPFTYSKIISCETSISAVEHHWKKLILKHSRKTLKMIILLLLS